MREEIIPTVTCDNYYDSFQHLNFIFSQRFILPIFEDNLMMKLPLR